MGARLSREKTGTYTSGMRMLLLLWMLGPMAMAAKGATSRVGKTTAAATGAATARAAGSAAAMDRDLMDVSVEGLHLLYRAHRYTVTQVVEWHLGRIARYDGVYRAVQTVAAQTALAEAAREDAEAKRPGFAPGLLWGVPVVVKANTSVHGMVTTDGWAGYALPGHELVAPRDATIVRKLRGAGAVLIGITNMPDFAASDTTRSTAFGRTGNAYDVRFSPGGSSGGTVTAVTANFAVLGNGTDTGNSIRMPVATSNLVGIFPTRGLVSIAGIAPLDWLLDNTGPIARSVADAAVALTVMAGEDALDPVTKGSEGKAQAGPYTRYLKAGSLKGKRFAVPAFILDGVTTPFHGVCPDTSPARFAQAVEEAKTTLRPETRAAFLRAVEEVRAAGATVLIDPQILPDSFATEASHICTQPYIGEGTETFLREFGAAEYHSPTEYERIVGTPLPVVILGGDESRPTRATGLPQAKVESDPGAEANLLGPRRKVMALYEAALDRWHLDGFLYPAAQMPPPDETMPQDGKVTGGPHSDTGWVNLLGVPAISFPAGFYDDGLPFGIEMSARNWRDGDLIGWAYDYEVRTRHRRRPVLVEGGMLPRATRRLEP